MSANVKLNLKVGTKVTNTRDFRSYGTSKLENAAGTALGVVVGYYTALGAREYLVRWADDTAPGAEKGRRTHPNTIIAL